VSPTARTPPLPVRAGRRTVDVSKPDKALFPCGVTKADLARHYADVAPVMLPHVKDRLVSMQRFPDGITGEGWYEKNLPRHFPDWIGRVTVPKRGGTVTHVTVSEPAVLVYLAGQGCITPHVWLSRADRPERPDRLVIDLDPSDEDFAAVRTAARDVIGPLLREEGLEPYAMTTGSRGIHVVAPLRRTVEFDALREWSRRFAEAAAARDDRLTTAFHKADRGGRILVDVMRNRWAQTAVPPYGVRPRPGAPVAVPIAWEELDDDALRPDGWTVRTIAGRLAGAGDPWASMRGAARAVRGA
jgi:bifunctional non-homologous end joining protein LigD